MHKEAPDSMNWMPILKSEGSSWRFPLPDPSQAAITEALLSDQADQQFAKIQATLNRDPALTLWVVLCANQHNSIAFHSTGEVAEWLAVFALDVLQWADEELSTDCEVPATSADQWSELMERSVHQSMVLANAARANPGEAESGLLMGLLHFAREWIRACRVGQPADHEEWIPKWLSERLSKFQTPEHAEGDRSHSLGVAKRWSTPIPGIGFSLASLTRKLARLKQLECDFQHSLQREKLAAMKELAYGASHEVNNPLANISTRAQTLLRDEPDPERRRKLTTINNQAFRAHEMISNLMHFARPPRVQAESLDLIALVNETITEFKQEAASRQTELVNSSKVQSLNICADRNQLKTAIGTLITNSMEALRSGGRVEIGVSESASHRAVERKQIEIMVTDDGPGIPDDVRQHLFDPFYSGREAGRGLGFGLCRCWAIVEQHGGRIDVQSQLGEGATFIIRIPSQVPESASGPVVAIS